MKTPGQRVRRGAAILAILCLVAAVIYHAYSPESGWIGAFWFVVITISSVGFGEKSTLPPEVQLLTIGLIVVGMSIAAYTFGGFIQMLTDGEIQRVRLQRRMTRGIEQLKGHVVLCGFGRTGHILCQELQQRKQAVVVVDSDPETLEDAAFGKYFCVSGDATEEATLLAAGIKKAKSLVIALPSDADNVFITLTSRNLNPDLKIIARAAFQSTEQKLRQAGANRVVMPASIGAQRMARFITRPTTAHLMDLMTNQSSFDIEMDELRIAADSPLVGVTIADAGAHRDHSLLFVAVEQEDSTMVFNPGGSYTFGKHDTVIVMGRAADIEQFREKNEG